MILKLMPKLVFFLEFLMFYGLIMKKTVKIPYFSMISSFFSGYYLLLWKMVLIVFDLCCIFAT